MDKQALLDHVNAAEAALYSALMGGGAFGATKLLQEALQARRPKEEEQSNVLNIRIPQPRVPLDPQEPGVKQADNGAEPWLDLLGPDAQKGLAVGLGAPTGFIGAKMLYDKMKQKQIEDETAAKEKHYLNLLANYKTAAAKTHPHIDGLIDGLVDELDKQADVDMAQLDHDATVNAQIGSLARGIDNATGGIPTTILQALGLLTGLTGAGVAGGMIYNDRKKKEQAATPRAEDLKVRLV